MGEADPLCERCHRPLEICLDVPFGEDHLLGCREAELAATKAQLARARKLLADCCAVVDSLLEDECTDLGQRLESESAMENASDAATSAAAGSPSISSAETRGAAEAEPASAGAAEPNAATNTPTRSPLVLEGWRCESFEQKTGHAVARSAQIGDLQVCLTVGETDGSEPQSIPEAVQRWLLTGEAP